MTSAYEPLLDSAACFQPSCHLHTPASIGFVLILSGQVFAGDFNRRQTLAFSVRWLLGSWMRAGWRRLDAACASLSPDDRRADARVCVCVCFTSRPINRAKHEHSRSAQLRSKMSCTVLVGMKNPRLLCCFSNNASVWLPARAFTREHVRVRAHTHTRMHVQTHRNTHTCIYIYAMHIRLRARVHTHTNAHAPARANKRTQTRMHVHTHIHTHTHTHILILSKRERSD